MDMKLNLAICYEWKFWFKTWLSGWGQGCRRCHAMSRPTGSNVEICLGNFAVGVVGKLRIETSSFVFCPRLMEVDPSVCSHSLHNSPSQPISKSDTKKRIFKQSLSWRDTNEGYQSAQSPLKVHTKIEKSRNFPKFVEWTFFSYAIEKLLGQGKV